jgi:hypothetical protein
MKKYLIILLLLFKLTVFSQGGFRTRYYPPNTLNSSTKDIFEVSPGNYIACGLAFDTVNGYLTSKLILLGLNSSGNVLWQKKYGRKNFEYLNNPFSSRYFYKQGNNIYTACCVLDSNNKQFGVLVKFDFNGDTLWQKIYRDTMDVIPQMVTGSVDGGFLITGFFQDWNGGGRPCMLIKTDALGNELWRKKINKAGHNVSDGKAIIQDTATGKIVIAGYQYVGSPSSSSSRDHILITDSLGNKLVQRTFYGPHFCDYNDLIQTKDKNVIVVGGAYKSQTIGSNNVMCSYIAKINLNMTQTDPLIWSNVSFDSPELLNIFTCIKELPNGELLVGGVIDTLSILQNWDMIRISKLNSSGTLISQRYYNYKINSPTSDNNHDLKSLNFTSDGGWVAGIGQVNFPNPNPLFYVKYDSTGCDSTVAYCLNPVGLQELEVSAFGAAQGNRFNVYPNPSSGIFEIASESELSGTLLVFDVFGRKIFSKEISDSRTSKVSLERYSNGIYLLEIREKVTQRTVYKEKLIKQD